MLYLDRAGVVWPITVEEEGDDGMNITCPYCEREIEATELMELDSNQMTPIVPAYYYSIVDEPGKTISREKQKSYAEAQQDMIKIGWRKVIE